MSRDPPYLGLWLEFEDGSKLKIILLCLAHLPVVQIRRCNARKGSYDGDPSHVRYSTKIRGVSRDPPYLGLWLEFEDGSKLKIILLCLAHLPVVQIRRCNARERSYDGDPSHVQDRTKIRGVSRARPYLGLWLEFEDGSCHTMGKRGRPPGSKDSRQDNIKILTPINYYMYHTQV